MGPSVGDLMTGRDKEVVRSAGETFNRAGKRGEQMEERIHHWNSKKGKNGPNVTGGDDKNNWERSDDRSF